MKASAPERIWINSTIDLPKLSGHLDKNSIEYIRTDAIIEKACSMLKELRLQNDIIEQFKNKIK